VSINSSVYPWKEATVVVLNKPNRPDYSLAKAYWPISLLECAGKLLEKIVAKHMNQDILIANLLPPTQFGSQPHYTTIDAVAVLTHCIQATCATDNVGALLLFDILGFYDNLHPGRLTQVICNKGFPPNVCDWVLSFLTNRTARLHISIHTSDPFNISHGTLQGSPLLPILSAFYTSALLQSATHWQHSDLSLYVNDGAIYTMSVTEKAAATKAATKYEEVLRWLHWNGLQADPAKTELMTFLKKKSTRAGGCIEGTQYTDPMTGPQHITATNTLCFLGVFINHKLEWMPHITIMANHTCSTVRGISILGNSI